MKILTTIISLSIILLSCQNSSNDDSIEKWKNEIVEAERAFAAMVEAEGIATGFLAFAADDAVIQRSRTVFEGKNAIKERFESQTQNPDESLTWEPDFVDVAASGDLGYTYGKYTFTSTDSIGNETVTQGIFHTVWRRQEDGSWKFVWD